MADIREMTAAETAELHARVDRLVDLVRYNLDGPTRDMLEVDLDELRATFGELCYNQGPTAALLPDDGATREAVIWTQGDADDQRRRAELFEKAAQRFDADREAGYAAQEYEQMAAGKREIAAKCRATAALIEREIALSQRPRAETPTDDKRDAARWRKVRPSLTTIGEDVAYLSVFEDAPSSHPGATVEDIVDALEEWERPESTAPRVPEAGSAPLPNEDTALLDALDAMREEAMLPMMPDGEPEMIGYTWGVYGPCETVREALRAHVLRDSQPSTSTTGEA